MNALQHLNALADQCKAEKYPNVPTHARVRSRYTDKSANDLITAIVDFLALSGYFSTRLSSTGVYRADLQKFVPSQQRSGLPDVFAVVEGKAVFVEVKHGRDYLSDTQKQTINELQKAGAAVYVACDFQGFFDWFAPLQPTHADALPLAQTHTFLKK